MTTLDLRGAQRLFWGATEAQSLYYGGTLLWTKPAAPGGSPTLLSPTLVLNTSDNLGAYTSSSSYAVAGGVGRILLAFVQICQGGAPTVITATANGAAMTRIVGGSHSDGASRPAQAIFAIAAPTAGARSIGVSLSIAGRSCTIVCAELSGANIAALTGASVTRQAVNGPPDRSLTPTATGSLLLGVQSTRRGDAVPFTPLPGVTEIADLTTGATATNDHSAFIGSRVSSGTSSQEVGGTDAIGTFDTLFSAVEIRPA